jgi:hypothetical protein
LTTLYSFTGDDGANPTGGLLADANGNLYGTTTFGGDMSCSIHVNQGCGTVFQFTGSGFVQPISPFAGTPGEPNCVGQSIAALAQQYGGIAHTAPALGYPSVPDLHNAVVAYCSG